MLLLVTIVLVLIAAVTLLIGIFGDSLALIFVSIGASVLAAVVLGVVSQMTKRRPAEATAGGPAPLAPAPAGDLATERIGPVGSAAETATADTATTVSTTPAGAGTAAGLPAALAGYDSLRVNEVIAKLEGLDLDELEAVAEHEESTKNRTSVLNKIDELMDALEAAEVNAAAPVGAAAGAAGDVAGEASGAALGSPRFPIADYDELEVDEIVDVLGDLDMDELETVAEYEETHANRDAVLDAIDDRLDELEGLAPAGAGAATAVKKTAKKATAKKSTAKKATAKKATATKAATRTPAKKASTTARTATKKAAAPARKATTSAKKATAKKAATKKATTAKKAAKKATRR